MFGWVCRSECVANETKSVYVVAKLDEGASIMLEAVASSSATSARFGSIASFSYNQFAGVSFALINYNFCQHTIYFAIVLHSCILCVSLALRPINVYFLRILLVSAHFAYDHPIISPLSFSHRTAGNRKFSFRYFSAHRRQGPSIQDLCREKRTICFVYIIFRIIFMQSDTKDNLSFEV